MKSTIFATALMMLAYAAGAKAQDKVRITVIPPENGTITVSPQLPPDCMVERGTKLTIRAAANKGYMLDGIYAAADQPYKYYNECCAPESLLVADKAMEVGVSFLPQKTFSKIRITNNVAYARPGNKRHHCARRRLEFQHRGHHAGHGARACNDREICSVQH